MFTIESESSPKEFKVDIKLNKGNKLLEEGGFYFVVDSKGEVVYNIGKAWAVDSEGNFIDTSYEQRGSSLFQTVHYTGENYPLTADPTFCSDTINNTETKWNSSYGGGKGTLATVARGCAKTYIVANFVLSSDGLGAIRASAIMADMWSELTADASFEKHVSSSKRGRIFDQFVCHAANPVAIWKSTWNLEPWRPDVSLWDTYKALCNP
jgi:hypothetical protein